MSLRSRLSRWIAGTPAPAPRAATQGSGGGVLITNPAELEEALRAGLLTDAGETVTPEKAMRMAAVYACGRIITGAMATMPLHIKRRIDERTREDASDEPLWKLLRRRPNRWQTPSQFRRMMQWHQLFRGNGYAYVSRSRGTIQELIPLHPDRVRTRQNDDMSIDYVWTRANGRQVTFSQREIFHLVGLTLDGVNGVTPMTYARSTVGLALAQERHGSNTFRNGAQVGGVFRTEKQLSPEGRENIRASLEEYRAEGESAGKTLILEEGLDFKQVAMTAEDAQWIESRKFSRSEIYMFFGIPPHMVGDTEKSTSWGTGIEQQTIGFVAYTLEDYLTMWEETIDRDLIANPDGPLYARINRAALVRGDIKARWDAYVKALQWGVYSPNEIRALEDLNPREGGDIYYPPPNTAGDPASNQGGGNEPA